MADNQRVDLFDWFNPSRVEFLTGIASLYLQKRPHETSAVVITHLLPDRPAFLGVMAEYLCIEHVFAIPYSTDSRVAKWSASRFPTTEPTLEELLDGSAIEKQLSTIDAEKIVLFDIGGYGAGRLAAIAGALGSHFCGVIEGTESGLVRYEMMSPAAPIVCMSRSPTKAAESALVGPACLFSIERLLRSLGFANEFKVATVLGYGRIGKSVAHAARGRGYDVLIYDIDPERRLHAVADGFRAPDRDMALAQADLVLAATGQHSWRDDDAKLMRAGTFLVSCSSKDVEFNFSQLQQTWPVKLVAPSVHAVAVHGKPLYFLYEGRPVDFADGANLGPLLTLVQAEMLAAAGDLLAGRLTAGVHAPGIHSRRTILDRWLAAYIDPATGWHRYRPGTPF